MESCVRLLQAFGMAMLPTSSKLCVCVTVKWWDARAFWYLSSEGAMERSTDFMAERMDALAVAFGLIPGGEISCLVGEALRAELDAVSWVSRPRLSRCGERPVRWDRLPGGLPSLPPIASFFRECTVGSSGFSTGNGVDPFAFRAALLETVSRVKRLSNPGDGVEQTRGDDASSSGASLRLRRALPASVSLVRCCDAPVTLMRGALPGRGVPLLSLEGELQQDSQEDATRRGLGANSSLGSFSPWHGVAADRARLAAVG